jgi:environmental stress-induced protein Ves
MRALSAWGRPHSPWKNGGGVTAEVAVHPAGATLETFEWRVSHATVLTPGPFSLFEGVDRTLAVVSRGALVLEDSKRRVRLESSDEPHAFAGEDAVTASVVGPPIEDINLMTRRSSHHGSLERLLIREGTVLGEPDASAVVIALDRAMIGSRTLSPLDAVWLDVGEMAAFAPQYSPARLIVARIWERPS